MKQAVHPYNRCHRIVPSYAKPKGGIRIGRANTAHRYHCHNKIVTCKYKKLFTSRDPPGTRLKAFCTHTSSKDVFYTYTNYKFVHSCGIIATASNPSQPLTISNTPRTKVFASSFISNQSRCQAPFRITKCQGIEHCPRECWRTFKARVIRGCTTSEDKVCLCRVTHALARWHTLLGTGMAASRPFLCFYSPHFSILHFT